MLRIPLKRISKPFTCASKCFICASGTLPCVPRNASYVLPILHMHSGPLWFALVTFWFALATPNAHLRRSALNLWLLDWCLRLFFIFIRESSVYTYGCMICPYNSLIATCGIAIFTLTSEIYAWVDVRLPFDDFFKSCLLLSSVWKLKISIVKINACELMSCRNVQMICVYLENMFLPFCIWFPW